MDLTTGRSPGLRWTRIVGEGARWRSSLVIWGLVCLTTGQLVYAWWLWVAVPPGAVLGVLWWTVGNGRDDPGSRPALPRD